MSTWGRGLFVLLTLAVGCGARQRAGTFDERGYRQAILEYRIANGDGGEVLGSAWRLDNYREDMSLKTSPAYVVTTRYDEDDDGDLEDYGTRPLDDLRYQSTRDAGVIWVRTLPLPRALATTELSVILRLLVDALAETGTVAAAVSSDTVLATTRTFTGSILDQESVVVDGREGIAATIEIANVAQLQLDSGARTERVRLVLVRTDYRVPLVASDLYAGLVPGLMMLGYSNLPGEFDRSLTDFEGLVGRVVFDTEETAPASAIAECPSPDGVPAFAIQRVGISSTYVVLHAADGEDRGCIERHLEATPLEAGRSYGFRPRELRFALPSRDGETATPAWASPPSGTAPSPAVGP